MCREQDNLSRNACVMMAPSCLGGCPAAHPAVSHPSLTVTAKPMHCRSSTLSFVCPSLSTGCDSRPLKVWFKWGALSHVPRVGKKREFPSGCGAKHSSGEGKSGRPWGPKLQVSCLDWASKKSFTDFACAVVILQNNCIAHLTPSPAIKFCFGMAPLKNVPHMWHKMYNTYVSDAAVITWRVWLAFCQTFYNLTSCQILSN